MKGQPHDPFAASEEYIPSSSSTVPGAIFPPNTHLGGNLKLIYGYNQSDPHQIRLRVSAKHAQATSINDYVAPSPSRRVKWLFHITLSPSDDVKAGRLGLKEAIETENKDLGNMLGQDFKIMTDGMRITAVNGLEVHIEARGARMLWTESKGAWTIFQATTQTTHSTTPSWLEYSDLPTPSPVKTVAPVKPPGRSTNLRPITSHIPLKVGMRPMETAFVAAAQKRKRSESPSKILAEASTSTSQAVKRPMPDMGSSSRSSVFPPRFPAHVGRESQATQPTQAAPSTAPSEPAPIERSPSRDLPIPRVEETSTSSRAVVYRLNPLTEIGQRPRQGLPATQIYPPVATEPNHTAPPSRSVSPTKPTGNTRAEAEAKARAAATRRHALRLVAEEEDRAKISQLKTGLILPDIRYTTLKEARTGHVGNIMGNVLESSPARSTKKDWILSIVITDPTSYTGDSTGEDMVITIFRKEVDQLPTDLPRGTAILFRNLKFSTYNDKVKGQAFSNDRNGWVYLAGDTNEPKCSDKVTMYPVFGKPEEDRLKALEQWWTDGGNAVAGPDPMDHVGSVAMSRNVSSGSGQGFKLRCLGDIGYNTFSDVIFKIIHVGSGSRVYCELYVVDGTVSRLPLRNFHNIDHPHVPMSGVFKIDIMHSPSQDDVGTFQPGKVVMLRNVRSKEYKGELEMIWSERLTDEQEARGWNYKRPRLISSGDERAVAIERRIDEFKTGKAASPAPKQESPSKPVIASNVEVPAQSPSNPQSAIPAERTTATSRDPVPTIVKQPRTEIRLATHVSTIHTDAIEHPTQTISEVLANGTFPNKFRVKARVRSIHNRGIKGNISNVQKHCGHCRRAIVKKHHCESCNDVKMVNASWRYHFIAMLEDEDSSMPILISDEEAACFLPALPPCSSSDNPNDIRKTYRQLVDTNKGVEDVLQAAPSDGIRPLPYIDWTIMSCIVSAPRGYGGIGGCKGVAVYKAFAMEGR